MIANLLLTGAGLGLAAHTSSQLLEPPLVLTVRLHAVGFVATTGLLWKREVLPLWKALGASLLLSLTYVLVLTSSVVIYRLYLHRLRRFPGDVIHKLTMFSWLPIDWQGRRPAHLSALHARYGPIVRTGPRELSVASVQDIAAIYRPRYARRQRGIWYLCSPSSNVAQLEPSDLRYETTVRTKELPAAAMRHCETLMARKIEELIAQLNSQPKTEQGALHLDFAKHLSGFTLDVASVLGVGKGLLASEEMSTSALLDLLDERIRMLNTVANVPYCMEAVRLLPSTTRDFEKWVGEAAANYTSDRGDDKGQAPIVLEHIFSEGKSLTKGQATSEVAQFILHSSSAVRSTVVWCVFELAQQPLLSARLQEEVKNVFGGGAMDNFGRLQDRCPFLNACITETLRLWPPVPSGEQVVTPRQGLRLSNNLLLPAKVLVSAPTYTIQRDAANFSSPSQFLPTRWLAEERSTTEHLPDAFVPFGFGRSSSCAEQVLVMQQCRMVLARLFRAFDVHLAPGCTPESMRDGYRDQQIIAQETCFVSLLPR